MNTLFQIVSHTSHKDTEERRIEIRFCNTGWRNADSLDQEINEEMTFSLPGDPTMSAKGVLRSYLHIHSGCTLNALYNLSLVVDALPTNKQQLDVWLVNTGYCSQEQYL
jgi:hypothetical protein